MSAFGAKLAAARAIGSLSRRTGRGGGTSLPGRVLLSLEPHAVRTLAQRLINGCAVISATNGKTTTATMAASILTGSGHRLVHNRAGANMDGGIASTLLSAAGRGGGIAGDLGLFEVDEFWLDQLTHELAPGTVALGNLFRDQLDRYGELETIADRWAQVVADLPPSTRLVLNADDPLVADLGRNRDGCLYFGIEDERVAIAEMQHAADSKHCRRCGTPYRYTTIYLGHLGHYRCSQCGQERPHPEVVAEEIELHGTSTADFTLVTPQGARRVALPLPGLYNIYNALAAASLCLQLGASLEQITAGLEAVSPAFGRAETISVDGAELQLLLVKNPAGANEVIRTLSLEGDRISILGVLNDLTADGRDVSWIWDADFELLAPRITSAVCSGSRAAELAVRLKYAGVPADRLRVVPDLPTAIDAAVSTATDGRLYALPTYTALLALRDELARRGHVSPYWEADQ